MEVGPAAPSLGFPHRPHPANTERMRDSNSFQDIAPVGDAYLLKWTAVFIIFILQVKGDSRCFSRRNDFRFERHRLGGIHICNWQSPHARPVFVIEVRDQASREKNSKRPRKSSPAVL